MTTITTKYPFVGNIDTRQGGRNVNEDNAGYADTPLGLLLVVCDGMGGGPGGRTASTIIVENILNLLSEVAEHTPRKDALGFAIEKANDILYAKANDTPELKGMGTTIAAVLINEESAVIAHVGDSRIYQLRKGSIAFRSDDHSVVANLVRQKKITEEEARHHPQSNVITRALGIRPSVDVEFNEVSFLRGDRFVICTDGVWGSMPQEELVESLSRVMGIGELASTLADEIDEIGQDAGGGHDNLTLAIIDASFNSTVKKLKWNKKKSTADYGKASIGLFREKWKVWISLTIVSIGIFLLLFILYYGHCSENKCLSRPQIGEIGTTVKNPRPITNGKRGVAEKTPQVPYQNQGLSHKGTDAFNNNQLKIVDLVKRIIENLDSLKKVPKKEGKKKNGENAKKNFIKKYIKPKVDRMKSIAVNKDKEINDIRKMLDDGKAFQCDKKGLSTKEGNGFVDKIKEKVEGLLK